MREKKHLRIMKEWIIQALMLLNIALSSLYTKFVHCYNTERYCKTAFTLPTMMCTTILPWLLG